MVGPRLSLGSIAFLDCFFLFYRIRTKDHCEVEHPFLLDDVGYSLSASVLHALGSDCG